MVSDGKTFWVCGHVADAFGHQYVSLGGGDVLPAQT